MPGTDDTVTWLTQEAHDRLSKELAELIANRAAIAKEINDRREEGDLRENGGYHAAREEQAKQEGRIRQLEPLLRDAKVGEAPTGTAPRVRAWSYTVRLRGRRRCRNLPDRLTRRGGDD